MSFIEAECSNSLLKDLVVPSCLEKEIGRSPVGSMFVYDLSRGVALFPHPMSHYSRTLDRSFTLTIEDEFLRVTKIAKTGSCGNSVVVYVRKETEHFGDDYLVGLVREALLAFADEVELPLPISVGNRTPPQKPPREPEDVIKGINKFLQIMPPGSEQLAQDLFVPALVKPAELNDFVMFGRKTGWHGLDPEARSFFAETLAKLEVSDE